MEEKTANSSNYVMHIMIIPNSWSSSANTIQHSNLLSQDAADVARDVAWDADIAGWDNSKRVGFVKFHK